MSQDEIFQKVSTALVDALGVDEDEVKADASISRDLGAESIDFLDIVFRLEKSFGIKIPKGELFPDEKMFSDPAYFAGGKLTAKGIEEIRSKLPQADVDAFVSNPDPSKLMEMYTVETIVNYVKTKLA